MRRFTLPCLGFALLLGIIYGEAVLQNDFVTWDDGLLITENPIVQEISWQSLKVAFTTYDPELYIPLTFLSYQLDHLVWGLNPVGFHLTNLVLHMLNVWLVYIVTALLFRSCPSKPKTLITASSWVPFLVALLFAVHPLHTEAVAWASARKDLLSGFFFLGSLCTYLKWRGQERVTLSSSKCDRLRMTHCPPTIWYWLSVFSFLFGLLSKVSIAPLPFILLLIDWLQERRLDRHTLLEKIPFFTLSIIFGIIAMFGKTGNTVLFSEKILIGAKAAVFYLEKILWPTGLSVLYPYTQPIALLNPDLFLPIILLPLLSAIIFFFRKKCPMIAYGWAFFLFMLLPSFANFAKGHDQLRDVYFASDRYAYLPSIGIFLLMGHGFSLFHHSASRSGSEDPSGSRATSSWPRGWERVQPSPGLRPASRVMGLRVVLFCVPLLLATLSFLSFRQSHVWHNTETLFQNVSEQYPESHIAWNNLGSIALERGDEIAAFEDYDRSLAIRPNAAAFFNLGQIALRKGLTAEAMELYRRAIASRPNDTDSLLNLGVLHLRTGDATTAADLFRRAMAFDDRLAIAHFNLGLALETLQDRDGARKAFANALALDPNDQETREKLVQLGNRPPSHSPFVYP